MSFKLQAQLVFDENDIESLIRDKVAESGYVLVDLEWSDMLEASVKVRPMTAEEREEHSIETPPSITDVVEELKQHIEEGFASLGHDVDVLDELVRTMQETYVAEFDNLYDRYGELTALMKANAATVRNIPEQVVEEVPPSPGSPSLDEGVPEQQLNGKVVASSIKDLLEQSDNLSPVERQRIEDKKKSRQRMAEIRAEQGSLEDAPVVQLVTEDGERVLGPNESFEFPD